MGEILVAESSTIQTLTSPNYPGDYDSNTICSWTIETHQPSDYVVEMTFDDFRLESDNMQRCGSDYLAVYDGLPQSGSDIGTFCGFIGPHTKVVSTGRHLSLRFVTNTGFNYRGFKLSYFAVPAGKPYALHTSLCSWQFSVGFFSGLSWRVIQEPFFSWLHHSFLYRAPQKPAEKPDRNCHQRRLYIQVHCTCVADEIESLFKINSLCR